MPPKFDGKAADALQVPRGPLRGVLCAGKPATLPDGRVIQPEQVLRGGGAGERVLLVDCPSEAHAALLPAALAHLARLDELGARAHVHELREVVLQPRGALGHGPVAPVPR